MGERRGSLLQQQPSAAGSHSKLWNNDDLDSAQYVFSDLSRCAVA